MTRTAIFAVLLLTGSNVLADAKKDLHGDPLPQGAIARLGTVRWNHGSRVTYVACLPDGKGVVSVGEDRTARLWDASTGLEKRRFTFTDVPIERKLEEQGVEYRPGLYSSVSTNGKRVAVGAPGGGVRVWDVESGVEVRSFAVLGVSNLALAPDGQSLALADAQGVRVMKLGDGSELARLSRTGRDPRTSSESRYGSRSTLLRFSADGNVLVYSGSESTDRPPGGPGGSGRFPGGRGPTSTTLQVHDLTTGKSLYSLESARSRGSSSEIIFSPDNETMAWSDGGDSIRLGKAADGKAVSYLPFTARTGGMAFSPDGKTLFARSPDYEGVASWDVATSKTLLKLGESRGRPTSGRGTPSSSGRGLPTTGLIAVSPDGKRLVLAGEGNSVLVLNAADGKPVHDLPGHVGAVEVIEVRGKEVLTTGADRTRRTWELATGKATNRAAVPPRTRGGIPSPDGKWMVTPEDGEAMVVRDAAGQEKHRFAIEFDGEGAVGLAFSPDGTLMAVRASTAEGIRVFNLETGKETMVIRLQGDALQSEDAPQAMFRDVLVFSADGKMLAAPSRDGSLYVWDLTVNRELRRFALPPGSPVRDAVFSPDGRLLALDRGDDEVSVWEIISGTQRFALRDEKSDARKKAMLRRILEMDGETRSERYIHFTPDAGRLVRRQPGGKLSVWDLFAGRGATVLDSRQGEITALAFAGSNRLLSGGSDGTTLHWDVSTARVAAKALKDDELDAAWAALSSRDGSKGFEAMQTLVHAPTSAVTLFRDRLKPLPPPNDAQLAKLIADLDSRQFAVRQKASDELERHGPTAAPALKKALKGQLPVGVRKTVEEQLRRAEGALYSEEQLRSLRAVEVLEHTATEQAREMLKKLAKGSDTDLLTTHARAALARLME